MRLPVHCINFVGVETVTCTISIFHPGMQRFYYMLLITVIIDCVLCKYSQSQHLSGPTPVAMVMHIPTTTRLAIRDIEYPVKTSQGI